MINLDDYQDSPFNPRIMLGPGDENFDALDRSFDELGNVQLLVVNEANMHIISGHFRKRVFEHRGIKQVEAVIVNFTDEKEKLAVLALNRLTGRWDYSKLANMLDELSKTPDIDMGLTGFGVKEVSQILDRYLEPPEEAGYPVSDDEAADLGASVDVKPGEVIELNGHRLVCGDSTDPAILDKLLGDEKVNLLEGDVPYSTAYDSTNRPRLGKDRSKPSPWLPIQNDDLSAEDHVAWLGKLFTAVTPYVLPGSAAYIWESYRHLGALSEVMQKAGYYASALIVWSKPNPCPGFSDYWQGAEFAWYSWLQAGKGGHRWYGEHQSNIWQMDREPVSALMHPTMKPVELSLRILKNSTVRGDSVLDPVMGAGGMLLACEMLGRKFRGVDIEPRYIAASVRRYISLVGKDKVSPEIYERFRGGEKHEKQSA